MNTLETIIRIAIYVLTIPPLTFAAVRFTFRLMEADAARQKMQLRRKRPGRQFY